MFHTSPVKHGWSVHLTFENYIDGNGNLQEDRECDGIVRNLPRLILAWSYDFTYYCRAL